MKNRRSKSVRFIPIPKEILNKNPMDFLMNPPIFPLLKGEEKRQIVQQLIELTENDKLVWSDNQLHHYQFENEKLFFLQVSYLGLVIALEDLDYINELKRFGRRPPKPGSGWSLRFYPNTIDDLKPDHVISFSFEHDDALVKKLTEAILAQGKRDTRREHELLKRIWEVLNLRRP